MANSNTVKHMALDSLQIALFIMLVLFHPLAIPQDFSGAGLDGFRMPSMPEMDGRREMGGMGEIINPAEAMQPNITSPLWNEQLMPEPTNWLTKIPTLQESTVDDLNARQRELRGEPMMPQDVGYRLKMMQTKKVRDQQILEIMLPGLTRQPDSSSILDNHAMIAEEVTTKARTLSDKSFENPQLAKEFRNALNNYRTATKEIQSPPFNTSTDKNILAQYQIDHANRNLISLNNKARHSILTVEDVAQQKQLIDIFLIDILPRLISSPPQVKMRHVQVRVIKDGSDKEVNGLQVYAIPGGLLEDKNDLFNLNDIEHYITNFSFTNETSPAVQDIAVFDTRIWVGPKFKFKEMARIIKDGKLLKTKSINDPNFSRPNVDLLFRYPQDVVGL